MAHKLLKQADGQVYSKGAITYVQPTKTSPSVKALQDAINAFVKKNIVGCQRIEPNFNQPPYPAPKGCSNNIAPIIHAFNRFLKHHSGVPKDGYTLDNNALVPTAQPSNPNDPSSNPLIPGTDRALNSSWWNAGEVYLMVDQEMAKNVSQLFRNLADLNNSQSLPHFSLSETQNTAWVMMLMPNFMMGFNGLTAVTLLSATTPASTYAPGLWKTYTSGYKGNPNIYNALMSFPSGDTLSLYVLSSLLDHKYPTTGLYALLRLYQVLASNDMLGENFSSTLPIKNAMDKIFTGLLGNTDGAATAASVTSLMNEVYNIGVTNTSYSFIGKNLSVIQNAQRTGMDMISTSINSIEAVYNHYQQQYQQLRTQVSTIGLSTSAAAGALSIAAIGAGFGGPFSAGEAAGLGAAADVAAQSGQMAIQIITMLKMSDILQSLMWLPIVIIVLTSLFTAGVSFALILPLMPFILFWAGQIAWILGCLEAVIAAPFLMMTLILPGGHHFAGHSIPGLRILLGIIFRPLLMVLGLLIGLVLTYIVISFSADAFHIVAVTLIGGQLGSNGASYPGIIPNIAMYQDARGIIACLMLFLYCAFLMMAFQKCFSPIYLLPEKVTQMMGGQADKAGEQDLQQLQQGVQQQSQSAAQAGGQGLNKGIEAQQQKTQAQSRGYESGAGAASKPYGLTKSGLYDKEAWQRQKDGSQSGSAGLSNSEGSGGGGSGGPSAGENAVAAQAATQSAATRNNNSGQR